MGNLEHLLILLKIGQQFLLYPSKIYEKKFILYNALGTDYFIRCFSYVMLVSKLLFERQQTIHIHTYIYSTVV